MQSMLPGAPWLLAHRSMLKANQPRRFSLLGNDYVLWVDGDGEIQALPNACPHMGAMLSEGWCENGQVVCPFHALAFDGAGCTVLPGSGKKTLPQMEPLELVIEGDFIWCYGGVEARLPIPQILNGFARDYEFIGHTGDMTVEADLLSMLLNMHDYNHQNGTHRSLFTINSVEFKGFEDEGFHSHAYYDLPRSKPSLKEIFSNPAVLAVPLVIEAHLENFFPSLVLVHGVSPLGLVKQVHLFIPESPTRTRTYVLMFGKPASPLFRLARQSVLNLAKTIVEQDAEILGKIYAGKPQKIRLNNEVGMDWVRRNFESFPEVVGPDLSR